MAIRTFILAGLLTLSSVNAKEVLVRFENNNTAEHQSFFKQHGGRYELVSLEGALYKWNTELSTENMWDNRVRYFEKNKVISLFQNPSLEANRSDILAELEKRGIRPMGNAYPDNPTILNPKAEKSGSDPMLQKAWGIFMTKSDSAWKSMPQGQDIVVAVTDTGVDYNHDDLVNNMWRNPGEITGDGIDNDGNGYIDDVVGWDFVSKDNKPYDLSMDLMSIIMGGGNPGHGTHVSGVIASSLNNSAGAAGVAPKAKIMALRFIGENGQGDTAGAIGAIDYAANNGAKIINASWGGEMGKGAEAVAEEQTLIEAIQRAEAKGVIFVAAAGNGRAAAGGGAAGFDLDTDASPVSPAALTNANIMTVAAINDKEALADFSNFGKVSVDIGAPGVKILSTVPGNRYQDTIIELGAMMTVTWDGTSMAAPFIAGALAATWSKDPSRSWQEVYNTLLRAASPIAALNGKVKSNGRLELSSVTF